MLENAKRLCRVLLDRKTRESLAWDIGQVIMEHMYQPELRRLTSLVAAGKFKEATVIREEMYMTASRYLQPELVRNDTVASFMDGED